MVAKKSWFFMVESEKDHQLNKIQVLTPSGKLT